VGDVPGDVGGGLPDGVAFEMGIARGRAHHAVAEEVADHRQGVAERERPGGICMTQVMQAHAVELGAAAHPVPGVVEVVEPRALLPAGKHERVVRGAGKPTEHAGRRGRHRHHARAGLRVGWMEYRPKPPDYMKKKTKYLFV